MNERVLMKHSYTKLSKYSYTFKCNVTKNVWLHIISNLVKIPDGTLTVDKKEHAYSKDRILISAGLILILL